MSYFQTINIKSIFNHTFQINLFILDYRFQSFLLDGSFSHWENILNWIQIWIVYWTEDICNGQFIHSLYHLIAGVRLEIVHVDTDIIKKELAPQRI